MSHLEYHPDHLPCDRGDCGGGGECGGLVWCLCGMLLHRGGALHPSWQDPLGLQGGMTSLAIIITTFYGGNFGRSIGNGMKASTMKLWKNTTIQVVYQ